MSEPIFNHTLDEFYETQAIGSINRAISNNLYGFNHRQIPNAVPMNKDQYGLTFFTRPQLNLTSTNIRNVRKFYDLLNEDDLSMQKFVRCTLDPRLENGTNSSIDNHDDGKSFSRLVNNKQAFIPLLTNALKSMSGWPDLDIKAFSSKEGLYREQYVQVDSMDELYHCFDITATFNNSKGDPIMYLFYIWSKYQQYVYEGRLVPYADYIVANRLDYNTRIYRIVLDQSKRFVSKISSIGVGFPASVPLAQAFDFNSDVTHPYNDQTKDLSIRFKCIGCEYYDPIVALEFNRTVACFNPSMRCGWNGDLKPLEDEVIKVPFNILRMFNFNGYPRINLDTYELEWWVDRPVWDYVSKSFLTSVNNSDLNYIDYAKFINDDYDKEVKNSTKENETSEVSQEELQTTLQDL